MKAKSQSHRELALIFCYWAGGILTLLGLIQLIFFPATGAIPIDISFGKTDLPGVLLVGLVLLGFGLKFGNQKNETIKPPHEKIK